MSTQYFKAVPVKESPKSEGKYSAKHVNCSVYDAYYYKDGNWYYTEVHAKDSEGLPPITSRITHWLEPVPSITEADIEKLIRFRMDINTTVASNYDMRVKATAVAIHKLLNTN